jgi:hypothetical protein
MEIAAGPAGMDTLGAGRLLREPGWAEILEMVGEAGPGEDA